MYAQTLALTLLSLPALALPLGAQSPTPPTSAPTLDELLAQFHRYTRTPLWPSFRPDSIPLAIFDGTVTWLVRHPEPPTPFRQHTPGGAWQAPGRHEAVRANSHAAIGDVLSATLIVDPDGGHSARQLAGTLIHETFHVYQARRHRDWFANEIQFFSYPWDDPDFIALRRLEGEALRRALAAGPSGEGTCWVREALRLREARYAEASAAGAEYERHVELAEGLATYVERMATGRGTEEIMPEAPFAPDAVRDRAYASGSVLALLLDRYSSSWKRELEESTKPLDELLATALPPPDGEGCEAILAPRRAADLARATERARSDVRARLAAREAARAEYLALSGWRLEIVSHAGPLWPAGFDPLNMQGLGGGEVLHSRWLKVGNASGEVEVLDRAALTVGAGEHPLFDGIGRMVVSGLAEEPAIEPVNGVIRVRGEGVRGELGDARVERSPGRIVIHLGEAG